MVKIQKYNQNQWLSPYLRDFFGPFFSNLEEYPTDFTPAVDVRETKDAYILQADLPGVTEKDITVEIKDGVLTVSGERTQETVKEGEGYHRRERCFGSFSRSFSIGDTVNTDNIEARFKNGMLEVRLPKAEKEKPRTIPISNK